MGYTAHDFPKGLFPNDKIQRTGAGQVEYVTPARTSGIGTQTHLISNDQDIHGFELLQGTTPDLLSVAVRLDPGNDEDELIYVILTEALEEAHKQRP